MHSKQTIGYYINHETLHETVKEFWFRYNVYRKGLLIFNDTESALDASTVLVASIINDCFGVAKKTIYFWQS